MEQAVHSYQFKSHTDLFQNKTWKPIFLNTYIDFYTCFTGDTETGAALHKNILLPYIPAYSATPCIIRVKIWGLGWHEKRLPLCIIRPQILDVGSVPVGSVPGHLNVRHGYYLIL